MACLRVCVCFIMNGSFFDVLMVYGEVSFCVMVWFWWQIFFFKLQMPKYLPQNSTFGFFQSSFYDIFELVEVGPKVRVYLCFSQKWKL